MTYASADGTLVFDIDFTFPEWMDAGECQQADPDLFFPEQGMATAPAKAICAMCPVRGECLAWSIDKDIQYGIWGGMPERERMKLRVARKKASPMCRNEHPRTEDNAYRDKRGRLCCHTCDRASEERRRAKRPLGPGSGNWRRERSGEGVWAA